MSTSAYYQRLTPEQFAALQDHPATVGSFFFVDDVDPKLEERRLDIDRSWHAIHFLLTGSSDKGEEPLYNAVLGGTPINANSDLEDELGVRFLTPVQVQEVAQALGKVPETELHRRFDIEALRSAGIAPQGLWQDASRDWTYVVFYYRDLVRFFEDAAHAGDAMLMWIM